MKLRAFLCLFLITLALVISIHPAQTATAWVSVAPGIEYQEFQVAGPNNVFVARMDRFNPNVTLETSIAQGRIYNGREKVSGMAQRYDQAINYWGESWGGRNRVVVAINGYFFDSTGPWRGIVQSGWYAKRFDDKQNGSGFGWTLDRNAFIGECVSHPAGKQLVVFANGNTQTYQGINILRGDNQLIVYTSHYDTDTNTDGAGVEVLVEMAAPAVIGPYATGIIRDIRKGQGSTPIPFDHVVLSASGDAADRLRNNTAIGEEIRFSHFLRNFSEYDCYTELSAINWTRTYASLGGSFYFLKNGKLQRTNDSGANIRNPRTAIAFNDQYIFFIVVDGRNPGISVGMTMEELGSFARDTLGATYGINQDGGGSSTMVVNGEIKNIPSDGLARPSHATAVYSIYLPSVGSGGGTNQDPVPPPPSQPKLERAVANGLLMVVVEPKAQSGAFLPNQQVVTLYNTDLRLGPGTNYGVLASLGAGSIGTISSPVNGLNGVLAKGSYWWKVDFGGIPGWVPEEVLGR